MCVCVSGECNHELRNGLNCHTLKFFWRPRRHGGKGVIRNSHPVWGAPGIMFTARPFHLHSSILIRICIKKIVTGKRYSYMCIEIN